jgi:hypothetical protein
MIPQSGPVARTYRQILLAPPGKRRLLGLLSVSVLLFTLVGVLAATGPPSYSGMAGLNIITIDVTYTSEQPVIIRMSHEFRLVKVDLGRELFYYVDDGVDPVNYTINITDAEGKLVQTVSGAIAAPDTQGFTTSQEAARVTVDEDQPVRLDPGRYTLSFEAWHDLSYKVIQRSRFDALAYFLGFLGVLTVLGMFFLLYQGYRAWEREVRAVAAGTAPPLFGPGTYHAQPPPSAQYYDPGNYRSTGTNVVSDDEVVEYMCAKCGNIIQNPIVLNVITCERCGEKEYVG